MIEVKRRANGDGNVGVSALDGPVAHTKSDKLASDEDEYLMKF